MAIRILVNSVLAGSLKYCQTLTLVSLRSRSKIIFGFFLIHFLVNKLWSFWHLDANRLAGAALIAPVINYWWPGFPSNLSTEAYYQQFPQDQWALRVAHYSPWLVYWWNTQKLFPSSSAIAGSSKLSPQDLEILSKLGNRPSQRVLKASQFTSLSRRGMDANANSCYPMFILYTSG